MALQVSDSASNRNEQIANAARAIGRSERKRLVFEAIHHHKRSVKTVSEIMERTGLDRMQVLQAGGELARKQVVEQVPGKEVSYRKNDFLQQHKREVLALVRDPAKRDRYPTKRTPRSATTVTIEVPASTASCELITLDDIKNFERVRNVSVSEYLPTDLSERAFKEGIQAILNEPGRFGDWGGEKNDLLTTRLLVGGRRRAAAFAFKGPGTKGTLTPKKMGKNGDQIQRLFQSATDVFILQYWRDIGESVLEQMKAFATARSVATGSKVWFGVIDGFDSRRIYKSYPNAFGR